MKFCCQKIAIEKAKENARADNWLEGPSKEKAKAGARSGSDSVSNHFGMVKVKRKVKKIGGSRHSERLPFKLHLIWPKVVLEVEVRGWKLEVGSWREKEEEFGKP